MKRIGILGGSFNPIHKGHTYIAMQAKNYLQLDEVIFIPNRQSPFKSEEQVSFEDRYEMVRLAVQDESAFVVSTIEQHLPQPSYTINTILALREHWYDQQEEVEVFFLIGDDQAVKLHEWKSIEELSQLVTFGIFVRHETNVTTPYRHVLIPADVHEASSTKIRKGDFTHLHPAVRSYIVEKELYLADIVKERLPEKRYLHTLSVRDTAIKIGKMHGLDTHKLSIASYFHDIAKYLSKSQMANYMANESEADRELPYPIHHQFASAQIVKQQLLIEDEDIIQAIRNHTTGGDDPYSMTLFIADKIEPLRNYDVSEEWALLEKDLKIAYEFVKQKQLDYISKENFK